jgi:hypothetical protein
VWLALSLLAYNLGNLWRRLVLPKRIENWSLPSLQQRLVKTGGRLVKHVGEQWDGCMISAVFEPKRKFRLGGTMVNSPPHPFVFRCMDQELAPLRTRREFLSSATLSALLAVLPSALADEIKPVVSVVRIRNGNIDAAVEQAIELLGGMAAITRGEERILLKPNLVAPLPEATTKLPVMRALVRLMRAAHKEFPSAKARPPRPRSTCAATRPSVPLTRNSSTACSSGSSTTSATPNSVRRRRFR